MLSLTVKCYDKNNASALEKPFQTVPRFFFREIAISLIGGRHLAFTLFVFKIMSQFNTLLP